ncbi:uncharacterized protein P884DRAFT_259886 [Thermothelomyces heterothallicus CBS 202.75]|uniref:uncharacterized protein n=1 Tax=Thermothelomyces heterothallicus CBS 202.75 TaxID=1149848 RepID=UPI0037447709
MGGPGVETSCWLRSPRINPCSRDPLHVYVHYVASLDKSRILWWPWAGVVSGS